MTQISTVTPCLSSGRGRGGAWGEEGEVGRGERKREGICEYTKTKQDDSANYRCGFLFPKKLLVLVTYNQTEHQKFILKK